MFKIILESANGEQLDRVYDANNVEYLQQDEAEFAMLGELSTCSYDVFKSLAQKCKVIKPFGLDEYDGLLCYNEHSSRICCREFFIMKSCFEIQARRGGITGQ
ncbi:MULTISPECIES: hypothetical protein [Paenibacillus]|uniref:hypothetical protein n=1 Tax=Paenibacillus TaxID=44249 RepID=UPI002FE3EE3C